MAPKIWYRRFGVAEPHDRESAASVDEASALLHFPANAQHRVVVAALSAGHAGFHRAPEAAAGRLVRMGVIGLVEKHQSQHDKERG